MIFQRQVEDLQNLEMQLDSAAANADTITRGHYHAEHQKLAERQNIVQDKATERQQALASYVDIWRRFNNQRSSARAVLDRVESKLPEHVDVTCDVPVLRQQLTDCEDASDKLRSEKPCIDDATDLGQLLLQHVTSPYIRSQVDDLSDRIHRDTQKTDSSIQRYLFIYLLKLLVAW